MSQAISNFPDRFRELLEALKWTNVEAADRLEVSRQTISAWATGVRKPKSPMIAHIASVAGVSYAWLNGWDSEMTVSSLSHSSMLPLGRQLVPILGDIACGEPMYAQENLSVSISLDSPIKCDFALYCKGDSMIGARILDGDIVFVKRQDYVDDGTIAVALIDDEATLKRVYHLADGRIELRAENPAYPPIVIGGEDETRSFRILGKAVAFQSVIR